MALRDCFETTDWEVLCSPHGEDIDSLTLLHQFLPGEHGTDQEGTVQQTVGDPQIENPAKRKEEGL